MTSNYNHIRLLVCVFFFLFFYTTNAQKKNTTNRSKTELTNILDKKEDSLKPFSIDKRKNGSVWLKPNAAKKVQFSDFKTLLKNTLSIRNQDVFVEYKTQNDNIGFKHHRYQQFYNNIKVEGGEIIIHEFNNNVTSVNGKYFDYINVPTSPSFSEEEAITKVKKALNIKKMMHENEAAEKFIKQATEDNNVTYMPKVELVIASNNYDVETPRFNLVYKINIHAEEPYIDETVYLNAITGVIELRMSNSCKAHENFSIKVSTNPNIEMGKELSINNSTNFLIDTNEMGPVLGSGETLYSGNQSFMTEQLPDDSYRLHDPTRGNGIKTFDLWNTATNENDVISNSVNWTNNSLKNISLNVDSINDLWESGNENNDNGGKPDLYITISYYGDVIFSSSISEDAEFPMIINGNFIEQDGEFNINIYEDDFFNADLLYSEILNFSDGTYTLNDGIGLIGSYTISSMNNPALDIHFGVQKAYDFYLSGYERNSYDGQGSVIKSYFNVNNIYPNTDGTRNNAFWDYFSNVMVFGLGDGTNNNPLVAPDVIGHEYTHAVIKAESDLFYANESGALNESFADIFGVSIEHSINGIEHNWLIGDKYVLQEPFYSRSLANPKTAGYPQPNTYNGAEWHDYINDPSFDSGGVHINSGVQNYWFYLLCVGGSGTIDDIAGGETYNVQPIGMDKALRVAYLNMTNYLTSNSNFGDAVQNSIIIAENLSNASLHDFTPNDVDQIRNAWHAVGLLSNPASNTSTCSGFEVLTEESGTLEDGSGYGLYSSDLDCRWLIKPPGATSITIDFTGFDTENGNDTVIVYEGESESNILFGPVSGDQIPTSFTSTTGAVLIAFSTNSNNSGDGWKLNYSSNTSSLFCDSQINLNDPSGTFTDGSDTDSYLPNSNCKWLIAPPGATSIELSVINLNTEANIDEIIVYDGSSIYDTELIRYSGPVDGAPPFGIANSTSGEMLVVFNSNSQNELNGWELSYTSDANPFCSGASSITSANGTITDGSGLNNYQDYLNCSWLIQPTGASSVTIDFTEFNLQLGTSDGQAYFDSVKIYDGMDDSMEPIGVFYGNNIPNSLTTTGGNVFITFETDNALNAEGWSLNYNANFNEFCSGTTILNQATGTFNDGSDINNYNENSDCRWLIQPENATSIILNFTEFDTEDGYDGIVIYEGSSTNSPILGVYTGTTLPNQVVSNSSSMLVRFISDNINNNQGWTANYVANISTEGISNSISGYEIWFNDDYLNKISSNIPLVNIFNIVESINTNNLQTGINTLHLRFKDNNDHWSSVLSEFVYVQKTTSTGTNNIVNYEYWFDSDYNNKVTGSGSGTNPLILNLNANLETVDRGLHQFHMRFKDEKGAWSSVVSEFIYNGNSEGLGNNKILAYRYWFNDDFDNRVSEGIDPEVDYMFLEDINISGFSNDSTNYIHFQFRDTYGNWSSVLTEEFIFETLSIAEPNAERLKLYPNPTNSMIYFNIQAFEGELVIYDNLGKSIKKFNVIPKELDISNLEGGLYLFQVTSKNKIYQEKVIKY